jgi:hypothetical protein
MYVFGTNRYYSWKRFFIPHKFLLKLFRSVPKVILSAELPATGKMVNLLPADELAYLVTTRHSPEYRPVGFVSRIQPSEV